MPTSTGRRSRRSARTLWACVAAALLVHGTVLGSVQAFDVALGRGGFVATTGGAAVPAPDAPTLTPTCRGDALLATGARAALCLAPWRDDVGACGQDLEAMMWLDLSACEAAADPTLVAAAEVALLTPRAAEALTPIDPEPLLEEFARQQEPPPPVPPPPPPQPQNQPPPPPPPPQRPAQVVEVAQPNTDQEPENARFLAENNVVVDKQTVARGAVAEPMVAKSRPAELTPTPDPKEAAVKALTEQPAGRDPRAPDVPGSLAMRAPGAATPQEAPQDGRTRGDAAGERGPLVADGFIPRRGDGLIEQQRRDPGELTRGQGGAGGGAPQVPNLTPSREVLERALGGGSVDHLEGVESGDETALSAKRWVYASFFNRLKRQVAMNWNPGDVWRRADPTGTVHGFKTRVTEVRVSLSATGAVSKVVVTSPSGVGDLDAEAVRAFRAAAPFPNPPDGLVKDGQITFEFSFHFEIGGARTSWRVIRQ